VSNGLGLSAAAASNLTAAHHFAPLQLLSRNQSTLKFVETRSPPAVSAYTWSFHTHVVAFNFRFYFSTVIVELKLNYYLLCIPKWLVFYPQLQHRSYYPSDFYRCRDAAVFGEHDHCEDYPIRNSVASHDWI
jgi:hypothetical protein